EWIVYTARRNFERDVFVYNIESGKKMNITHSGVSENQPFWGPSGKYIYFSASRTQPSYPRGGGNTNLYRMALSPVQKPFKSLKYDDLFREKADEDSTEKNIEINIRRQGLLKRIKQIGPRFGSQSGPYVIQKDDKTIVLYSSNHNEGKRKLWKTTFEPFKNPETEAFKKIGSTSNIVQIDN